MAMPEIKVRKVIYLVRGLPSVEVIPAQALESLAKIGGGYVLPSGGTEKDSQAVREALKEYSRV